VAEADPDFLFAKLGKVGLHFQALAHAEDSRPVIGGRSSKTIGSERTLEKDVCEKSLIKVHLRRSADAIGRRLKQKRNVAFGVGIKLKTADFQILTRQRRLSESTDVTERLYSVGVDLLKELNHRGPFRLVGMVAYDLVGIDDRVQLDLFSTSARQRRLDVAIDELVERFGPDVVHRANDLTQTPAMRDFLDDRTRD
jgi:DNA polymerase IV